MEKINIRFKLIKPGKNKLATVKAIHSLRSLTGWTLMESKDFVDSTDEKYKNNFIIGPRLLELDVTKEEYDQFKSDLELCDEIVYELTDAAQLRNKKLIQLGFYEKSDLIEEMVEQDLYDVLRHKDFGTARSLLIERYSNLPEEYLKEKLSL